MVSRYNRRQQDNKGALQDNLESRVSAVETAVTHIESSMKDIRESITTGFSELRGELDNQQELSRPKLAGWAGWAAVMLVVISMFGSGYVRDLSRLEAKQESIDFRVRQAEISTAVTNALREDRDLHKDRGTAEQIEY